jgi:hypothetical protein
LIQLRGKLDAIPGPAVAVDVSRIYRLAAEDHERRLRRWRRAAGACAVAAAAALVFLLVPHLEVQWQPQQLVIRWGVAPPSPASIPPANGTTVPGIDPTLPWSSPELQEQVQVLSELLQGHQAELARLQGSVNGLARQLAAENQHGLAMERDVAALSAHSTLPPTKGTSP